MDREPRQQAKSMEIHGNLRVPDNVLEHQDDDRQIITPHHVYTLARRGTTSWLLRQSRARIAGEAIAQLQSASNTTEQEPLAQTSSQLRPVRNCIVTGLAAQSIAERFDLTLGEINGSITLLDVDSSWSETAAPSQNAKSGAYLGSLLDVKHLYTQAVSVKPQLLSDEDTLNLLFEMAMQYYDRLNVSKTEEKIPEPLKQWLTSLAQSALTLASHREAESSVQPNSSVIEQQPPAARGNPMSILRREIQVENAGRLKFYQSNQTKEQTVEPGAYLDSECKRYPPQPG